LNFSKEVGSAKSETLPPWLDDVFPPTGGGGGGNFGDCGTEPDGLFALNNSSASE
jgi:hypothetical protein